MAAALREAVALGSISVRAQTTADNAGALMLLQRLGFDVTPADNGPVVHAQLVLGSNG